METFYNLFTLLECWMLYRHIYDQLYKHICMWNHNDDTIITTSEDNSLEKYTSHFIEGVMCERELETEQNCNLLTPTLMAISVSFSFSWAAQPGAWGPSLSGCYFLYRILSPTGLIFKNSMNFLCTELYNSSMPTQSLMHFQHLWNGMFDWHRAEITVILFTGHSLLVHQFVTVPWDFNPVPYC